MYVCVLFKCSCDKKRKTLQSRVSTKQFYGMQKPKDSVYAALNTVYAQTDDRDVQNTDGWTGICRILNCHKIST